MDVLAIFGLSLLGTLVLLAVAPFVRGRTWAVLWLFMAAGGGLVLLNVEPANGRSLVPLVVHYVAAAFVGGIAIFRQRSMALLFALLVASYMEGWILAQAYGAGPLSAGVCGLAFLAWILGWRQRLLPP